MAGSILLYPQIQSSVLNMVASWYHTRNKRHNIKLQPVELSGGGPWDGIPASFQSVTKLP